MMLVIVVLAIAFSTTACTDKKPEAVDSVAVSDTIDTVPEDTLVTMIEEQPMPKAADELFDDFFFNFAGNKKLQRKRIVFPLPVYAEEEFLHNIPARQWKIDHFFMHQEYYTLIFNSRSQMNLVKDTTIHHVVVEKNSSRRRAGQAVCL